MLNKRLVAFSTQKKACVSKFTHTENKTHSILLTFLGSNFKQKKPLQLKKKDIHENKEN
jgi:hypothetical protein